MTALSILKQYWNHNSFRKSQEEIIKKVLLKNDVLALLPTGGGKSVCYQVPALLSKGTCIVISPLIALMQDQVNSLNKKGLKAIAITSKLSEKEIVIAFDNMLFGNIKFLYLSPEKLKSELIQEKIKQLHVNLIAIDEAHCISQWGHDFRPSYLNLTILRELQPKASFIALTATATKSVIDDIKKLLSLKNVVEFKDSFQRANLAYQFFESEDIYHQLKRILNKNNEPTIIYVNTRNKTKIVSDYLNTLGYKSTFYHGGLGNDFKEKSFKNWMDEKSKIMVATNAFGMGIDKDNVKIVVHIELPNSIENYIQEAGRAGRDGKKAFSVVLYNNSTLLDFDKKIKNNIIEISFIKDVYINLNQYYYIAKGELSTKFFVFNIQDFCARYTYNIGKVNSALQTLEKEGVLIYNQIFNKTSTLKFSCSNEHILNFTTKNKQFKNIIQLLLRSYGGIFENTIPINETYLANKLNISKKKAIAQLVQIAKANVIHYQHQSNITEISFTVMREDQITINRISKNIKQRNTIKIDKSKAFLNILNNNKTCRNIQLLTYFDEIINNECGICDVCIQKKNKENKPIDYRELILSQLANKKEFSSKELIALLNINEHSLIKTLKKLLEQKAITLTNTNTYKKK